MKNNRMIKAINLNAATGDLIIQFRGRTCAIEANALEIGKDADGNINRLLLDRLIHEPWETAFDCYLAKEWPCGFMVVGCYVSELIKIQT